MKEVRTTERMAITIPEAAKLIGVSNVTMWKWVAAGKIPSIKVGNKQKSTRRILVKDFEAWLESMKEG